MTSNEGKPGWEQVFNAAGERSRGLWKRGSLYYVQATVLDPQTGRKAVRRLPLPNARTEPQARKIAEAIKIKAVAGDIYRKKGSPMLSDYIPHYLEQCHKSEHTKANEKIYLEMWLEWLGDIRLSNISPAQVLAYRTQALKPVDGKSISKRTVNVRVNALKSLLKLAKLEGKIQKLPTEGITQLKHQYKPKALLTPEQMDEIISKAETFCPRSGKQFSDYVKLCAYSGGREQEVLNLQWSCIHFDRELIEFRHRTKFDKVRSVNFNPRLREHLQDMFSRKTDSPWLFPSPRSEGNITTFKKTQEKVEAKTGLDFSDHSFRHYFASMCVMSNIDFMSIAKWLGHSDGGILVAKTYGHLNNAHLIDAAKKVSFAVRS